MGFEIWYMEKVTKVKNARRGRYFTSAHMSNRERMATCTSDTFIARVWSIGVETRQVMRYMGISTCIQEPVTIGFNRVCGIKGLR